MGTPGPAELFNRVRESLGSQGSMREVFTFVAATQLIGKVSLWREGDGLLSDGEAKRSNSTVGKVASAPAARFGKKGRGTATRSTREWT